MANIEYTVIARESSNATLDFITNRPVLSLSFWTMKGACALLCAGFAFTLYHGVTKPQDYVAVAFAIAWLFYYKNINRYIVKLALKKTKFDGKIQSLSIDSNAINGLPWKRLRYINKNQDGYIIPIPGIANSGKFIWIPYRAFDDQFSEREFLDLVAKHHLKINTLK